MKKYIIILCSILFLVGCSITNTPKKEVSKLFKKYQTLDESIIKDLELISEGNLLETKVQKEYYMKAMKMQYSDIKYQIINEKINGDEATVEVKITVYDFYKAQTDADNYKLNNPNEFLTNNVYDNNKFMEYKLKQMMNTTDRVEYTIYVYLTKKDKEWKINNFDNTTLEKIHGIYNYESK